MAEPALKPRQQFKTLLLIDFEATCNSPVQIDQHEIIEFPVLAVDSSSFEIKNTFHSYVRPQLNPILSDFCVQLTGIDQDTVDNSQPFPKVFEQFMNWMIHDVQLLDFKTHEPMEPLTIMTCGNWDLSIALWDECVRHKIAAPRIFRSWINIKKSVNEMTGSWPKGGLAAMLQIFEIEPVGRAHSGIDDCRNMLALAKAMADKGYIFKNTNKLT